jgi:hypothetical protein
MDELTDELTDDMDELTDELMEDADELILWFTALLIEEAELLMF